MHTLCEYVGANRTLEGDICITFAIDDEPENLEKLEKLMGKTLALDVKKYNDKRSLNANAYFWKLCDMIAKKLGSNKDTIYLMQLKNHGVYEEFDLPKDAIKYLNPLYRLVEVEHYFITTKKDVYADDYEEQMANVKCYIGSSHYDSKEMADLINGTVEDCKDLGIETWTQEEIDNLVRNWQGRGRYDNEV